jgi:hypothetical protein
MFVNTREIRHPSLPMENFDFIPAQSGSDGTPSASKFSVMAERDCPPVVRTTKMIKSLEQAKRYLKILFGFTLLAIGVVMIVTPGPGWVTIMLGLGVLAAEYVWARRLLDKLKEQGVRLRDSILPRPKTGPA